MAIEVKTSKNKFTIKNNCILISGNLVEYLELDRDQYYKLQFNDNELHLIKTDQKIEGFKFYNSPKTFKMVIRPEYIPNKWQLFFAAETKVDYAIEGDSIIISLITEKVKKTKNK